MNTGWILHVFIYLFYFGLHFKGWGNLSYLTRDWIHAPFSGNLESTVNAEEGYGEERVKDVQRG